MKATTSIQGLEEQIEQVVRGYIEATRRAAAEAMERAFSSSAGSPSTRPRTRTDSDRSGATSRASSGRRSPAELSAVGERLHKAVCAHPGETMSVLAPAVGKTPRELSRPMMALKRAGRVRSVGQRDRTRYFPTVTRPDVSAD
jgi:hypothetical protein